jgi:hypothetical protein
MSTREVLREEWGAFFDAFSGAHRGWLVSLEVFAGEQGAQREVRDLPLEGISADFEAGATQLTISVGGRPEQHITHTVSAPLHVWIKSDEDAAEDTLELETRQGVTLLRVRQPTSDRHNAA